MLADLSKSVELLNTISYSVMAQYDLIYNGNVQNWVKLANSLMLRIAVRVHFIDETLAKEYITKALDPKMAVLSKIFQVKQRSKVLIKCHC